MISPLFNVDLLLGKSAEENKKRVTLIFYVLTTKKSSRIAGQFFFHEICLAFCYHRCGPDMTS